MSEMTEREFFDELDLLAIAYACDVVRGPVVRP